MAVINGASLISVYTSPLAVDAELVRNMLVTKGVRATVMPSNGPFSGLLVAPSEVLVWQNDEARARTLIEQAETRHHERVEREALGCCDADRQSP
jgi:hypothetical protein